MAANSTSFAILPQETSVLDGTDEFAGVEQMVRQHGRFVFKVAYGVLRNSHDAEDVVQEVFLRVHRSGTKDVADMPAWLARIAYRLALDRLRRPSGLDIADIEMTSDEPATDDLVMHRQRV